MAQELYGSYAQLGKSQASTPVSTDTIVYFIGTSASGELHKAHLITSMSDYAQKLGGAIGDGHNLTEAAIAAFNVVGINRAYFIPVSHDVDATKSDYMGSASLFTGMYALEAQLRDNPTTVNLVCAPSVTDDDVLTALLGLCKKADGHWDSFMVYDIPMVASQINASGYADAAEIVDAKQIADEQAKAVWGRPMVGSSDISGAAVQACLMAKSDASYGCPARCGGNLPVDGIQGIYMVESDTVECDSMSGTGGGSSATQDLKVDNAYVDYVDGVEYSIADITQSVGSITNAELIDHSGKLALKFVPPASGTYTVVVTYNAVDRKRVKIPQVTGTQLSADGVCSWINYSGQICTWGDHTSAFSGGTVADERARFDNSIRMLLMITNRFQLKYRFSIDDPMDLSMRNDVIDEELTYMNKLVSIGGLIGEPVCEFRAVDNGNDQVAQGYFTWKVSTTPTIPAKYMLCLVSYSSAGLSVYTQAA